MAHSVTATSAITGQPLPGVFRSKRAALAAIAAYDTPARKAAYTKAQTGAAKAAGVKAAATRAARALAAQQAAARAARAAKRAKRA